QLVRLADAIAQRVGQQRFNVWFNNSTKLELKQDGLEIAVPNDFISEWIATHFTRAIQEAAHEVLGCSLTIRFHVMPQLFEKNDHEASTNGNGNGHANGNGHHGPNGNGNGNGKVAVKPANSVIAPRLVRQIAAKIEQRGYAVSSAVAVMPVDHTSKPIA